MRLALSRGSKRRRNQACLKPSREGPRWTAKVNGDKTERFLPRSASWIEEMEKRSHRRIRDLDVLTAFQGLVANEIGCARISMMARKQETLPAMGRIQMRKTNYLQIVTSGLHRTAGPYMVKRRSPPSQGWRAFLHNHAPDIAAMDLFIVPTIGFDLLYAFVIVRLDRRDLVWINVTTHPTAEWVARQITEAFPWDGAPGYMIRDRDRIYGAVVTRRLRAMGIRDKPIAPASPWQNGFVERLIGSIRRECVDYIIILGEAHLRRILKSYARYLYEGLACQEVFSRLTFLLFLRFKRARASAILH